MAGLLVRNRYAHGSYLCDTDNSLLSERHSRPFEKYLKSKFLSDYRELTGDDTNDLSNLLRQMLVLDPKQRRTAQEILKHKWFTAEPNLVKAGFEEETQHSKDELGGICLNTPPDRKLPFQTLM